MIHSKVLKILCLAASLATLPTVALAAANVTFSTDTAVVMTGPGINLTAQAGSVADTFTVNTSTIDLVIDAGNSVTLIDPAKGQINNNGGVNNCHLVSDQNVVTFIGPLTVTVTPSTITCVTTTTTSSSGSSNGGGGTTTVVVPQSLTQYSKLDFTINTGEQIVSSNILGITLNADPKYVSGFAISLDKNFTNASIIKYTPTTTFALPQTDGTYNVYLKYYSTTGNSSGVISRTINYKAGKTAIIKTETAPALTTKISKTPAIKYLFKRNLSLGMTGADVKELQKYLNANGYTVAKTGAGSPGNEITKFGSLTQKALIKFQKSKNIKPAAGYFGTVTRGIVNK